MPSFARRLTGSVLKAMGRPGEGTSKRAARASASKLEDLGIRVVGIHSDDDDVADWEAKLWESAADLVEELSKEWLQILLYCSNRQWVAWHRTRRAWIPRKTAPWRIRSSYNIMDKAASLRVSRLTENKPSVSVQATSVQRETMERAEYKEHHWWYLWHKLRLHLKIVLARRWATKTGIGFLKVGWDPDAGPEIPATKKRVKFRTVQEEDPVTGQLITRQAYDGIEEYYVGPDDEDLGPVEIEEEDPETGEMRTRAVPPPEDCERIQLGEAFVTPRSPFNIRWDRYTDWVEESWYVQDADIVPGTTIAALFPEKIHLLKDAKAASEADKVLHWTGLTTHASATEESGVPGFPIGFTEKRKAREDNETGVLDRDYVIRETWIFPKNELIRRLWGHKGALIITVGGKVFHRSSLPEWALQECPFIQFNDVREEGNHYNKSILRDLLPIQDDINRTRSHMAERLALRSRLIMTAPRQHGMNLRNLAAFPAVLLTHKPNARPDVFKLDTGDVGASDFYNASLQAAADVGNMNEASTGKLPSAGLAAKALYALQYADERMIAEVSNDQDISLARLARALDAVTRIEYKEERKIRLVGQDHAFMVEYELRPEHLEAEVDYVFVPGSMLSRQKEAVKNEMMQLQELGLVGPAEIKRFITTAVPDAWRQGFDQQYASVRRKLDQLRKGSAAQIEPDPWEDPTIGVAVLEEFMLTRGFELLPEERQDAIIMLWQGYHVQRQQQMQPQPQQAPGADVPDAQVGQPVAAEAASEILGGTAQLEAETEAVMEPPEDFMEPAPVA